MQGPSPVSALIHATWAHQCFTATCWPGSTTRPVANLHHHVLRPFLPLLVLQVHGLPLADRLLCWAGRWLRIALGACPLLTTGVPVLVGHILGKSTLLSAVYALPWANGRLTAECPFPLLLLMCMMHGDGLEVPPVHRWLQEKGDTFAAALDIPLLPGCWLYASFSQRRMHSPVPEKFSVTGESLVFPFLHLTPSTPDRCRCLCAPSCNQLLPAATQAGTRRSW